MGKGRYDSEYRDIKAIIQAVRCVHQHIARFAERADLQCCGMPLADDSISREKDGFLNEDYCKWCYADGVHLYSDMEDLIEVCVKNMPKDTYSEEEVRAYLRQLLPQLEYWKRAGEK